MRNLVSSIVIVSLIISFSACNTAPPVITDEADYIKKTEAWQQQRVERLKSRNGYLNLAGLFWLKEGENSFGSDSTNDIVFPPKAEPFCGTLLLENGKVKLTVSEGTSITVNDTAVTELQLANDMEANTTHLEQGDLAWHIIERGDRYAIRLRDYRNPSLGKLDHIPSYPIQTSYVVDATLEPFDSPRTMTVATEVPGYNEDYQCPGTLNFKLRGKALKLYPFTSGSGYFLIIGDETSGVETYGAGRFMYASPDSTGRIILDFNRAYNPPCAFTPYATCPKPPRENILPIAVEAGEKTVHMN